MPWVDSRDTTLPSPAFSYQHVGFENVYYGQAVITLQYSRHPLSGANGVGSFCFSDQVSAFAVHLPKETQEWFLIIIPI